MDGEDLEYFEDLKISVGFLSYKCTEVLENLKELIPRNMVDDEGRSLVHWAADKGQASKVRFLVENDLADPAMRDQQKYTALELACKKKHSPVIAYFRGLGFEPLVEPQRALTPELNRDKEGVLIKCIYADNPEELKASLEYVKNLNGYFSIHDYYEWTLLGVAGFQLAPKCLELLLDLGCSPDICDGDGLSFVDNVLNSLIQVIPPENEEEFVEYKAGMQCVLVAINKVKKNMSRYKLRLNTVFTRSEFVGKGSSVGRDQYEENVIKTNKGFRLMLGQYLETL